VSELAAGNGCPIRRSADDVTETRTIEKLLRQQAALANFGGFAFGENDLQKILNEAARICAASLGVPFAKICRYREDGSPAERAALRCRWS
jgi:hypothetical protein